MTIVADITSPTRGEFQVHEEPQGNLIWWHARGGMYSYGPIDTPSTAEQLQYEREQAITSIKAQIEEDDGDQG